MKYKRILFLILLFFPALFASAYDSPTTHAGISEQGAEFYNYSFSRQLSAEEKEAVIKGSIDEDYPEVRVLNHFYDPVREIGINGYRTAGEWAVDEYTENAYIWSRAIESYAKGDEDKAFLYLGHVIHLIQDMTVPDHTRNDSHIGDGLAGLYTGSSSFEDWASVNKKRGTLDGLALSYFKNGDKPIVFGDLFSYFDLLSEYSNKNFFGDDSIQNGVYQYEYPKIVRSDTDYGYGFDKFGGSELKLVKKIYLGEGHFVTTLSDNNDTSVLSGYFDRLGRQAVLATAGVIDLFLREAEPARKKYLAEQEENLEREVAKAVALNSRLSGAGTASLISYAVGSSAGSVASSISNMADTVGNGFSSGSKIAFSGVHNAGSFAVFSAGVLAKEAVINIAEAAQGGYSKVAGFLSKQTASVSTPPNEPKEGEAGFLAQNMPIPNIGEMASPLNAPKIAVEKINKDNTVSNSDVALGSDLALETAPESPKPALDENKAVNNAENKPSFSSAAKQAGTFAGQPYSPGFGGGEEVYKGSTFVNEENVDKSVDNPVENLLTNSNEQATTTNGEIASTTVETVDNSEKEAEIALPEADITPPDVFILVSECANSLTAGDCFLAAEGTAVSWGSSAEDLDFYEVDLAGTIATTTATSTYFSFSEDLKYLFSVVAVDKAGNKSSPAEKAVWVEHSPVIINEIAWGGTAGHSEDEWIELYNKTARTLPLSGWSLYSKTDHSPDISLEGEIPAGGYYLIERKNEKEANESEESPVKNIPADLWVSFGLGLSNGGEQLVLSRASTTIDEVPFASGWSGGSSQRSWERYSPYDGGGKENWTSNNGEIRNGVNVSGAAIFGTPKARNSVNHLISRTNSITGEVRLSKENSPYFVPKNNTLAVGSGGTIVAEPGTVIKFADGALINAAGGNIEFAGSESEPVVLTSFFDDSFAGDTNGDGVCGGETATIFTACPKSGLWYGVWLSSGAVGKIDHALFRFGGMGQGTKQAQVCADSVSPEIAHSIFEYSSGDGVALTDSSAKITDSVFRFSSSTNSAGLRITRGAPSVSGNRFLGDYFGIYSYDSDARLADNSFEGNLSRAVLLSGNIGGEITGNEQIGGDKYSPANMINLTGRIGSEGRTATLAGNPMPYFIYSSVDIVASSTLNIERGAEIVATNSGASSRFVVNGELGVNGAPDAPVVFSAGSGASAGGWQGIVLNPGSVSRIRDAVFKDAVIALSYNNSPISLENVLFSNNKLAVSAKSSSVEKVDGVAFSLDNIGTTSPFGLW